jgi:hypothetical protein
MKNFDIEFELFLFLFKVFVVISNVKKIPVVNNECLYGAYGIIIT